MKLNKLGIISVVPCLLLALSGQTLAQTSNDWQFPSFGSGPANSVTNTPTTAVDPFGGTPLAIVVGANNTYYFGAGSGGPNGVFGPPTGLWDVEGGGQIQLTLDRTSASPVDFTVVITQFADRSFYPGTVSFSVPGATFIGETVVVPQTGNMTGSWYADTYHWSQVDLADNPITLDIGSSSSGVGLLVDDVQFSIVGTLTVVPEPGFSQLAAAGLLAFGMRYWSRRKAARASLDSAL
jgi:hypothetical protein